jgi:hypothetical protein
MVDSFGVSRQISPSSFICSPIARNVTYIQKVVTNLPSLNMSLVTFLVHAMLSIGLFFITNWIGKHSYSIGYMQISIFVKSETAPAFNFLFRVLSPVVYIIIASAGFYKFGVDELVVNIYLVPVYYIVFRLIFNILTNRARLLNWRRQVIQAMTIVAISWLTYDSVIKNKRNILPDFSTISNELWIVILLFLFQVLNNLEFSNDGTEKRKEGYLKSRYFQLKNRYGKIISEGTLNLKLEALVYAILIVEDFNRPRLARQVENIKFRLTGKPMTLGIMQVRATELIDDMESIRRGTAKLVNDLNEIVSKKEVKEEGEYRELTMLSKVVERFNGGKSYNHEVANLFSIIWEKFYDGNNQRISFEARR